MTGYVYRSTRTTDEHIAYKFADDLYHQQLVKVHTGGLSQGTKITVGIDRYIERFEADVKQSVQYRILLLKRVKLLVGKQTFDGLTTSTISKLTDDLRKATKTGEMSPNTVKRIHNDLRNFFRWCVEEGLLKEIPKFPRINSEKSRRPHFNEAEWRKLVRYLREFVKVENRKTRRERKMLIDYVLILANTGIRVGEARTLKWRDIREVDGGTGKPKNVVLTVTGKTGIREVVARTPDVKKYVRRIYDLRIEELDGEPLSSDGLVFCHKDGSAIGSFKKSFQSLLKACGLEKDSFGRGRTVYSLRHTYATFRLHEGVNHYTLSRNMGTSVQMLEEYYGHTSNLTMSEELTKGGGQSASKGTAKRKSTPKSKDTAFGWLETADTEEMPSTIVSDSAELSVEPTYVDLMTE
ncbi:tyrosine-type recombinase/integrase [Sphingopyxis sp. NFH-91]|uniref:tyrosine-type recombinase/integrase n=1 Tax=Sphingopyxis sp. NFH-91 TaxID=2744457 RepID=UPI001F253A15|nr:tyrosine-type recombinase/integrase [Sphingopyxis sp. NFH-91]